MVRLFTVTAPVAAFVTSTTPVPLLSTSTLVTAASSTGCVPPIPLTAFRFTTSVVISGVPAPSSSISPTELIVTVSPPASSVPSVMSPLVVVSSEIVLTPPALTVSPLRSRFPLSTLTSIAPFAVVIFPPVARFPPPLTSSVIVPAPTAIVAEFSATSLPPVRTSTSMFSPPALESSVTAVPLISSCAAFPIPVTAFRSIVAAAMSAPGSVPDSSIPAALVTVTVSPPALTASTRTLPLPVVVRLTSPSAAAAVPALTLVAVRFAPAFVIVIVPLVLVTALVTSSVCPPVWEKSIVPVAVEALDRVVPASAAWVRSTAPVVVLAVIVGALASSRASVAPIPVDALRSTVSASISASVSVAASSIAPPVAVSVTVPVPAEIAGVAVDPTLMSPVVLAMVTTSLTVVARLTCRPSDSATTTPPDVLFWISRFATVVSIGSPAAPNPVAEVPTREAAATSVVVSPPASLTAPTVSRVTIPVVAIPLEAAKSVSSSPAEAVRLSADSVISSSLPPAGQAAPESTSKPASRFSITIVTLPPGVDTVEIALVAIRPAVSAM